MVNVLSKSPIIPQPTPPGGGAQCSARYPVQGLALQVPACHKKIPLGKSRGIRTKNLLADKRRRKDIPALREDRRRSKPVHFEVVRRSFFQSQQITRVPFPPIERVFVREGLHLSCRQIFDYHQRVGVFLRNVPNQLTVK